MDYLVYIVYRYSFDIYLDHNVYNFSVYNMDILNSHINIYNGQHRF